MSTIRSPSANSAIIRARLPDIEAQLAGEVVRFVRELRSEDLEKKPGIAETLDWAASLFGLDIRHLADDPGALQASLICLLKTEHDLKSVTREVVSCLVGKAA